MKLLNKSLFYLSISLFLIIGAWSVVFYFNLLREIKENVDEGLEHYKRQIISKAQKDTTLLLQSNFNEGFFAIRKISKPQAISQKDTYIDTLMFMQDADDETPELEPARLLTTAFENNGNFYKLQIINSMVEEDDLVAELLRDTFGFYVILITSIILIHNFVLQQLWKPFYSFLNQLRNYRIGSTQNFPEINTKIKEFIDLQQAVSILLRRNIETYEQQKQFIENASHELQTPLATAINKLELLVEKGNLQNDQAENIADIMQIIGRLVRLNKSLLLLTKIENRQFLDTQLVLLNEVVKQNVRDLEEIAEYRHLKISVLEAAELTAYMDSSLANVVVSNLLRNAIFHNIKNGTVIINISKTTLKVSNTGKNTPINEQRLFSRFYKTENETNGTGLGLAIIKAVCNLYGFTILYRFENDIHSFELNIN